MGIKIVCHLDQQMFNCNNAALLIDCGLNVLFEDLIAKLE